MFSDKFYTSDINECMSSVLGLNETKDDIATIIKYRGQRFLEAKDKARFERNHVFLLENDPVSYFRRLMRKERRSIYVTDIVMGFLGNGNRFVLFRNQGQQVQIPYRRVYVCYIR